MRFDPRPCVCARPLENFFPPFRRQLNSPTASQDREHSRVRFYVNFSHVVISRNRFLSRQTERRTVYTHLLVAMHRVDFHFSRHWPIEPDGTGTSSLPGPFLSGTNARVAFDFRWRKKTRKKDVRASRRRALGN